MPRRNITSTPGKTPTIGKDYLAHDIMYLTTNALGLPLGTQFQKSPGVIFPKYWGNLISFSFFPFPKKFNANQSRILNQFKMVCQLELSICLSIYYICLSTILCIFVKISY